MTRMTAANIAERKAQLATRAALERMRFALALHAARTALLPPPMHEAAFRRPLVAILIGIAAKRVGSTKLRRWLRIASLAMVAYRIARSFQR
ncbi:MAG: hypothetical protein ACXWUB_09090 [Burkholderiales bacterium]